MPALRRGDGVATRHVAVPALPLQARLLRRSVALRAVRRRCRAGGVLVAPGDTDGVASALTALLTDEGAREEMSERAREQSLLLTLEAVGETFTRLLEDVVARPARR